MDNALEKIKYYIPLAIIVTLIAIIPFTITRSWEFTPPVQAGILSCMAIGYALWGITHHHAQKKLNKHIVSEYLLIALILIVFIIVLVGGGIA